MKIDVSDGEGEDIGIDISPLVDVMFILIIFFLVTTSFHQQQTDMAVNLPETDLTLSSAVQVLVINVRRMAVTLSVTVAWTLTVYMRI